MRQKGIEQGYEINDLFISLHKAIELLRVIKGCVKRRRLP